MNARLHTWPPRSRTTIAVAMFIAARGGWTARTASTTGRAAVALVLFRPDLLRKQTTVPKEEDLGNERCSEKEKRTRSYHAPPLPLLPHLDHWLPLSAPSDNAQPLFNPGSCLRGTLQFHFTMRGLISKRLTTPNFCRAQTTSAKLWPSGKCDICAILRRLTCDRSTYRVSATDPK